MRPSNRRPTGKDSGQKQVTGNPLGEEIQAGHLCRFPGSGGTEMPEERIADILGQLRSTVPAQGWKAFLGAYGTRMMHVVRQYENDALRAEDCFVFACESLCEDGFRRLRQFDLGRGVPFQAWLDSVVSNLCIDWYRREHGRNRPASVVATLPELERLVYQYKFEAGMSLESCFQTLRARFPNLTRGQMSAAIGQVHALLTPRQRWRLTFRKRRSTSFDTTRTADGTPGCGELADPRPGPEAVAERDQQRKRLLAALAQLPAEDRLLLRLRFQEDLPLREVARLSGLSDPFQARRRIDAALATLADLLPQKKRLLIS